MDGLALTTFVLANFVVAVVALVTLLRLAQGKLVRLAPLYDDRLGVRERRIA